MELAETLPLLLGLAWLLPLGSFALIVLFGPRMGKAGRGAGYLATGAVLVSFALSAAALLGWISHQPPERPVAGDWYSLGEFGPRRVAIDYYIDSLTLAMFCMVTLVGSCIHVYSLGYMHEELQEVTDPLVKLSDGRSLRRRGRFHRFFQSMSLFCFSMLGLVIAGNVLMVFVFWELVGICSYLLIGFYHERKTASDAANKAFLVNRIGDFGMIVGLMAVWTGLGTFSFGDYQDDRGVRQPGVFSQVRPASNRHELTVPDGMVKLAARSKIEAIVATAPDPATADAKIARLLPDWRRQGWGYGLLVVAGLGIFCGCVGKSAQVPLHVWLPDAMEGPTPVSALIHAATMVAAGVYLVGRFYPLFAPEVLLVIAYVGCITLFIAATIAITATDIKQVLAYSTVSQLGYMMLALGTGGWLAGLFHLFTHACFKSLLFLCSGSVIHACGTNEMPQMGGLLKKMPWTGWTMLVGCLAISGAGLPLLIGFSGYHSKDCILAQALAFKKANPAHGWLFYVAVVGAGITACYMFRLWYLTFVGRPRDEHAHRHAHESPPVMYVPLVILAALAVGAGWKLPGTGIGLEPLLEQSRPAGTAGGMGDGRLLPRVVLPREREPDTREVSHETHVPATLWAFAAGLAGFGAATLLYGVRRLDPQDVRHRLAPVYRFLMHKWWFDELYGFLFVRPVLRLSRWAAAVDRRAIDWLADHLARGVAAVSRLDDWIDRLLVDAVVDLTARWTWTIGVRLRAVQTGSLRQYVMLLAVATVTLFVVISLYWSYAPAGY